ncbi:SRPBCC family protein [Actinokineospora sp. HUAS TT18]|uniref:SRPBCC family protein n=1 Tax=Actinokineospora sp. HUAS TT18 TaxID=3447451 RepID=UPI003F521363
MQLAHTFTVPADIDTVWATLMDPERVALCMPGATLTEYAGTTFAGTVKVKLGPITLLYKGTGEFTEADEDTHKATIKAAGKDSRGNGTAAATIAVALTAEGDATTGQVTTDLAITGKPAQFGRGMIAEVGGKILESFATCLSAKLGGTPPQPAIPKPAKPAAPKPAQPTAAKAATPAEPKPAASAGAPTTPPAPAERAAPKSAPAGAATTSPAPAAAQSEAPKPSHQPASAATDPKRTADPASRGSSPAESNAAESPAAESVQDRPQRQLHAVPESDPIDLMEFAGPSIRKRLLPLVIALAIAAVVIFRRKR